MNRRLLDLGVLMGDLESKIRSLASLQVYAMEQDGAARRAMEKALVESSVRQSREIALWQIGTLSAMLFAIVSLLHGASLMVFLLIYVLLVFRCIAAMAQDSRALASAITKIDAARDEYEKAKAESEKYTG